MMKFKLMVIGVCFALAFATRASMAAVITFDSVSSSGNPIITTLTTDGFTFTSGHFHTIDTTVAVGAVDNGTIYIAEEAGSLGLPITMVNSGGNPFSLAGIDGAEVFLSLDPSFPDAAVLVLDGVLFGGGTLNTSFDLDGLRDGPGGINDFQSFVLPGTWTNLASVTFSGRTLAGGPGGISLDNINVNATIPEPTTMLLLGGGLLGLLGLRKKIGI